MTQKFAVSFALLICSLIFSLGSAKATATTCGEVDFNTQISEFLTTVFGRVNENVALPNLSIQAQQFAKQYISRLSPQEKKNLSRNLSEMVEENALKFAENGDGGFVRLASPFYRSKLHMYSSVLQHPIVASYGIHELVHYIRFLTRPTSSYVRSKIVQHTFTRQEETEALTGEYDFLKPLVKEAELEDLKLKHNYKSNLAIERKLTDAKVLEMGLINFEELQKYEKLHPEDTLLEDIAHLSNGMDQRLIDLMLSRSQAFLDKVMVAKLNRLFIKDYEAILRMNREDFVDSRLQNYEAGSDFFDWSKFATKWVGLGVAAYYIPHWIASFMN